MSHASQPITSKRRLPHSGAISIRFAPGQDDTDLVFTSMEDVYDFYADQADSDITLYIDLSAVGGVYTLPTGVNYDFRRMFLDGFFNPDGSLPCLIWPDGIKIIDDCDFLRKRDIDFQIEATTTIPWTPNKATRIEDEENGTYVSTTNTLPFISTVNMGSAELDYKGGLGCGFFNSGGSELIHLGPSDILNIVANDTCQIQENVISTQDATSTINVQLSTEADIKNQSNVLTTNFNVSSLNQSGAAFPEKTYPGKLFLLTTDDVLYQRNSANTAWIPKEDKAEFLESPGITVNGVGGTFVTKITGNLNFISGDVYEISVSYIWGTSPDKTPFRSRLFINGVAHGITTVVPNTFIHYDEVVKATDVTELVPGAGTSYQKPYTHIYRYTATATGPLPVILDFGPKLNTGYMARAVIRSRRLPA